ELPACRGIREHAGAQRSPIERALGGEDIVAEHIADRGERGLAGLDHLASDHVRVDYWNPELLEEPRHGRLAARNPPRQPNLQHRAFPGGSGLRAAGLRVAPLRCGSGLRAATLL